jgi:hypothetical protein
MSDDQDWRLQLDLDEATDLDGLVSRVRGGAEEFQRDTKHVLGDDVVLTHDGEKFFAYAPSENSIEAARHAIESLLTQEQRRATVRVSHWDDALAAWLQTDPPLSDSENDQARTAAEEHLREREADAARTESRTVVATAGKLVRKSFEEQMLNYARSLGLECSLVEHPHLLSTQIAFKVTGPASEVDEFASYVDVQARSGTRMDLGLQV